MKIEIKIPQMGESVTEATIGSFLKPSGSGVEENDEIIELETEKVNQVLYAPGGGVVSWDVNEGDTVSVGDTIGFVDTTAEKSSASPKKSKKEPEPAPAPATEAPKETRGVHQGRQMTEAFLADLEAKPSEPPMSPQKQAPSQPSNVAPRTEKKELRRPMSRIRKVIASRLVEALNTSAMLTTFNEVDMSAIMALRAKYKESFVQKHGVKLGFMSFFVKAIVDGLKAFPDFNSYIDGDDIVSRETYDIGIAVGTERGLVVPIVRGCDELTFAAIEQAIAHYAQKARNGRLSLDDLQGGGFTLTNGGVYGSLLSTPILNPPQVGILGMHSIVKRPVVIDGDAIVVRPMMYLAVSYDHRIVDGKEAVTFLVRVKEVLEDPSRLMFIDADL